MSGKRYMRKENLLKRWVKFALKAQKSSQATNSKDI
jgi:hypothetical protein